MKKKMSKKAMIIKSLAKSIEEIKAEKPGVRYVEYDDLYYTEEEGGIEYCVLKYNYWSGSCSYESRVAHEYLKKYHKIIRNDAKFIEHVHANATIIQLM